MPDVLLLCEHPHVITLGRNGKREHLRAGERRAARRWASNFTRPIAAATSPITAPGRSSAIRFWISAQHSPRCALVRRQLEEVMIRASADFGVTRRRDRGSPRRLGGRSSRWRGKARRARRAHEPLGHSHGFAYNVSTDLRYFDLIVPCGIAGNARRRSKLLGRAVTSDEVAAAAGRAFGEVFGAEMIWSPRSSAREELWRITRSLRPSGCIRIRRARGRSRSVACSGAAT